MRASLSGRAPPPASFIVRMRTLIVSKPNYGIIQWGRIPYKIQMYGEPGLPTPGPKTLCFEELLESKSGAGPGIPTLSA